MIPRLAQGAVGRYLATGGPHAPRTGHPGPGAQRRAAAGLEPGQPAPLLADLGRAPARAGARACRPPAAPVDHRVGCARGPSSPLHHRHRPGGLQAGGGEYALATFAERWHAIVSDALGDWRGEPADPAFVDLEVRARATAEFVLEVVRSAESLPV